MRPYSPRALAWTRVIKPYVGLVPASRNGREDQIENLLMKTPRARAGGEAQRLYQEIVPRYEIISADSDRFSLPEMNSTVAVSFNEPS